MGYQVSAGSEAAAFISGQSGGYPKTMSAETDKLRLQHVLSPASSTLRTSQTQVRYRSLPNELGTEGLHLPGSSNNNGVDSQALQTMLDEAVLVFSETANRDADARHEKKILDLIQEMSASLQLSADFRSLNEISQQEHRLQMARLLEEATQLYVEAANNGDYAAARKQRGRMQIFATKFRAMKIPDQMEAKNSIDLASFNSRLEEIKNEVESLPPTPTHQTSATTSRVPTLPTIETEKGTETTVAAKKDIAPVSKDRKKKEEAKLSSEKLIFPNDDHPDVDELEKLFVQAADLYKVSKEKAGPSQEDIKELLEEIDHVLQQAKAVEKEKEKENVMAQVEDRSRLKVAQEIEAALQLHMVREHYA